MEFTFTIQTVVLLYVIHNSGLDALVAPGDIIMTFPLWAIQRTQLIIPAIGVLAIFF